VARQYRGSRQVFLTDPRFKFAWERTYRHVPDDLLEAFCKALHSLMIDTQEKNRERIWRRLCADESFMRRLYLYLRKLYTDTRLSKESDTEIFALIASLSKRMFASELERDGEGAITSARCLDVLGLVSQFAEVDGSFRLSAQLCIAYARGSFLRLCQRAFEADVPALSEEQIPTFFDQASCSRFRLGSRHPDGLLLLLVTGSFDGFEWRHRNMSPLLPLHKGDCCRSWMSSLSDVGLEHVAACNALTFVVHSIDATDEQRAAVRGLNIAYFMRNWMKSFPVTGHSNRAAPSPEFISILYSAGLHEWTEPGSTYQSKPREGPNYDFLTGTWLGRACVDALRALARRVLFEAYGCETSPPSADGANEYRDMSLTPAQEAAYQTIEGTTQGRPRIAVRGTNASEAALTSAEASARNTVEGSSMKRVEVGHANGSNELDI
ncbi:hypothetical protein PENSPDRAFT_718453, partial [Peniophora sp. CONT]